MQGTGWSPCSHSWTAVVRTLGPRVAPTSVSARATDADAIAAKAAAAKAATHILPLPEVASVMEGKSYFFVFVSRLPPPPPRDRGSPPTGARDCAASPSRARGHQDSVGSTCQGALPDIGGPDAVANLNEGGGATRHEGTLGSLYGPPPSALSGAACCFCLGLGVLSNDPLLPRTPARRPRRTKVPETSSQWTVDGAECALSGAMGTVAATARASRRSSCRGCFSSRCSS